MIHTSNEQSNKASTVPLNGVRVIEFGQFIAVPAAGQTLADLGADVIKIEPEIGDAARITGWTQDTYGPMFTAYNRGKRSVVLDLRSAQGREAAVRLAQSADIVLQNMRPGTMEKYGLGAEGLVQMCPRLIYGQVSGFGQVGDYSQRPGLDIAAQAESGMMSINGPGDGEPTRVGFTAVDTMASHALVTGVLAALVRRGITGKGGTVDVSLIDVAVESLANLWADYRLNKKMPLRCGNGQPFAAPAADIFPTADGMVVISAYLQEHFGRLCKAVGMPELVDDQRFKDNALRVANRPALRSALATAFASTTTEAVCALLRKSGVVAGAVKTLADVGPGKGGVSEDLFVEVGAVGRESVRIPGLPLKLDGLARTGGALPALGEHTEEILGELFDKKCTSFKQE